MTEATCLADRCVNPVDTTNPRDLCAGCHDTYYGDFYRCCPPNHPKDSVRNNVRYAKAQRPCMHPDCYRIVEYTGGRGFCTSCLQRWKAWLKRKGLTPPPQRQNIDARYPSDAVMLAYMEQYGSLNRVAIEIGVVLASLTQYLDRRGLREAMEAHRQPHQVHVERRKGTGNQSTKQRRAAGIDRRQVTPITPEARVYERVLRKLPCTYCGAPGETVDHVVAITKGGGWQLENLVPACKWCNNKKRDKPLSVFLFATRQERMARRVAAEQARLEGRVFGYMTLVPLPRTPDGDTLKAVIPSPVFTSGQQLCLALLFADGSALNAGDANAGPRSSPKRRRR